MVNTESSFNFLIISVKSRETSCMVNFLPSATVALTPRKTSRALISLTSSPLSPPQPPSKLYFARFSFFAFSLSDDGISIVVPSKTLPFTTKLIMVASKIKLPKTLFLFTTISSISLSDISLTSVSSCLRAGAISITLFIRAFISSLLISTLTSVSVSDMSAFAPSGTIISISPSPIDVESK